MNLNYEYLFKLVVLGEPRVGKTSLILRYLKNIFSAGDYAQTLGANFLVKRLNIISKTIDSEKYSNSLRVLLQIWDLAGHMRHTQVKEHFYQGAAGCILVWDVKDPRSYENLSSWYIDVQNRIPQAQIVVLANKADLLESNSEIKDANSDLESVAKEFRAVLQFSTSAKTGNNVEKVFTGLTQNLVISAQSK